MPLAILNTATTEYLHVTITATSNPTGDPIEFSFVDETVGGLPSVWEAGEWVAGGPPYVARILMGPSDVALAEGTYRLWARITDTPEAPVFEVGDVIVSDEPVPTSALATLDDLAAAGVDVSDTARAEFMLRAASEVVRNWTGQTISFVANDVLTFYLECYGWPLRFILPEFPVASVASIALNSAVLDPAAYLWTPVGIVRVYDSTGAGSSLYPGLIQTTVTYSHGYEVVPADVVLVVCRIAARMMTGLTQVGSITREQIGTYSYEIGDLGAASASSVADSDRLVLSRYRSKKVV